MSNIVIVGDYNADLVLYLERFPQPGETLNGNRFFQEPGGKGSNQAIGAARLGAEVTILAAIGQDHFGGMALSAWQSEGINTEYVKHIPGTKTAVAMIYVDSSGDNMIAVNQGANLKLTREDVLAMTDSIAAADVLICTLGVPLDVVAQALQIAREHNTKTILNPAPAKEIPSEMLFDADYITPNESELDIIARSGASNVTPDSARYMLERDEQVLIVTQGEAGVTWVTKTGIGSEPTFEVKVQDTVGAGDAFNAGLAVALAEGHTLLEMIRFANATAALSVQEIGAVAGMSHRAEVDALLAKTEN